MFPELMAACDMVDNDDHVRAGIVTGAGRGDVVPGKKGPGIQDEPQQRHAAVLPLVAGAPL